MTAGGAPRRHRGRILGLRGRLVVGSLLLVCFPLVVVSLVGVYEDLYRRQMAREVRQSTEELAAALRRRGLTAESFDGEGGGEAGGVVDRVAHDEHLMVRVVDRRGRVLRRTAERHAERWSDVRDATGGASTLVLGHAGPPELLAFEATLPPVADRAEVREALGGDPGEAWRSAEDGGMFALYRAVPLEEGGALYATRVSRRGIRSLYELRFQLLRLTAILALFAVVMGLWIGRRFVAPLLGMQRRIARYLSGPRSAEAEPSLALDRRDEIGDLSHHFQELTDRLSHRVDETAAVASDLAHDLKNPIATVEATAELLDGEGEVDEDRRARLARALGDASHHMRRSVDGLLELARLDEGLAASDLVEVDLVALCRRIVDGYDSDPRAEGVELSVHPARGSAAGEGLRVRGMPDQLERLVGNLVDNALDFSEGRVRIDLEGVGGSEVRLAVADDGAGVSAGNRDKVFRRFYSHRPDGAGSGTGLGLAIVERIALAHGGRAELGRDGPLSGACFEVFFPAL